MARNRRRVDYDEKESFTDSHFPTCGPLMNVKRESEDLTRILAPYMHLKSVITPNQLLLLFFIS